MGDRSNVVIESNLYPSGSGTERVYLYSHYDGASIIDSAVHGIQSGRSTDGPYLTRVIFADMIKDDMESETGYGISASITDNEHPLIVIQPDTGSVLVENASDGKALAGPVPYSKFLEANDKSKHLDYSARYDALVAALA
jgi:hypothetical protein